MSAAIIEAGVARGVGWRRRRFSCAQRIATDLRWKDVNGRLASRPPDTDGFGKCGHFRSSGTALWCHRGPPNLKATWRER